MLNHKRFLTTLPLALTGIFLISIALYVPTLKGGPIWDDTQLISGAGFGHNDFASAFTRPFLGHYFRPLTSASLVIDSLIGGKNPLFYHWTNLLLHAITAVLVSCLTLLISRRRSAAVLAGIFFATQPLQVGATAWIGGRTDALSAMFLTAMMVALVQHFGTGQKRWLPASVFCFLLASLSKEQAIFVLPAVPLSVFVFGSKTWKDAWLITRPFLFAVAVFAAMWFIDAPAPYHATNSILATLALFLRTAAHYGLAWLVPNKPSMLTFTLDRYQGFLWLLVGAAVVGGFAAFIKLCWKNHLPIVWLALCGVLVYLPVSNLPPIPSFVVGPYRCAESGTVVACLFGVIAAYAVSHRRYLLGLALSANLVAGTIVTWWGIHQWNNDFDFFSQVARTEPHFLVGVGNFANALDGKKRVTEELKWTSRTLCWMFGTEKWEDVVMAKKEAAVTADVRERLRSNSNLADVITLGWLISVYATALAHSNRIPDAIRADQTAIIVSPRDPKTRFAYGQLMLKTNKPEAIHQWEVALQMNPNFAACATALAHERVTEGKDSVAVKILEPIVKDPGSESGPWIELAKAKLGLNDIAGAKAALDGANHAAAVKKDEIETVSKRIQQLEAGQGKKA